MLDKADDNDEWYVANNFNDLMPQAVHELYEAMDAVADMDKADECQMSEDKNLNDKPHYSKSIWWQIKSLKPVFWIFVLIFVVIGLNYYFFGSY